MMRSKLKKALLVGAALVAMAGVSNAALVTVETHNFEYLPGPAFDLTPWATTFNVPSYDPAAHGGAALAQVMVNATGIGQSFFQGMADGDITINGLEIGFDTKLSSPEVAGLALSLFQTLVLAPPPIALASGTPFNLDTGILFDNDMATYPPTPADLAAWTLAVSGPTVEVDAMGDGFLSLIVGGGNLTGQQVTLSAVTLEVIYKIDEPTIPEPATMLLLGTGLLGVGFTARRRMKK